MDNLDRLIREIDGFPTLPNIVTEALEELERPECDFQEVASLIALDPVLAARVLRLANSAFFGAVHKAKSLERAICRLGIQECRGLLLTVALMTVMPELPSPYSAKMFWTLSLASALIAHELAKHLDQPAPDRAYLAGLVHLLGEALLAVQFTERFRRAIGVARRDGLPLVVSLTEEFGCDHPALTAVMLRRWSLPEDLIEAVRSQLGPAHTRGDALLPCLIAAADGICRDYGLGLEDQQHVARGYLQTLPECFHAAVRHAGYGSAELLLDAMDESIKEAIDFAVTVF